MMKNYIIIIALIFCWIHSIYGQDQNHLSWLHNDSIQFVVHTTMPYETDKGSWIIQHMVIVINMDSSQRKDVIILTNEELKRLLYNQNTDWALNLILYDIHGFDGLQYQFMTETDWRTCRFYRSDKRFWTGFIRKRKQFKLSQ